jgi:hypothetical protein
MVPTANYVWNYGWNSSSRVMLQPKKSPGINWRNLRSSWSRKVHLTSRGDPLCQDNASSLRYKNSKSLDEKLSAAWCRFDIVRS